MMNTMMIKTMKRKNHHVKDFDQAMSVFRKFNGFLVCIFQGYIYVNEYHQFEMSKTIRYFWL